MKVTQSCLFVTPWTIARQVPLSMEFSRQEYWSGLPFPSPGDLPDPGIELRSHVFGAPQVVLVVKNPPTNAGNVRDVSSIPGSGRSLGEGHGNPLQYSCLENPMDREAWRTTVHKITKFQTTEAI